MRRIVVTSICTCMALLLIGCVRYHTRTFTLKRPPVSSDEAYLVHEVDVPLVSGKYKVYPVVFAHMGTSGASITEENEDEFTVLLYVRDMDPDVPYKEIRYNDPDYERERIRIADAAQRIVSIQSVQIVFMPGGATSQLQLMKTRKPCNSLRWGLHYYFGLIDIPQIVDSLMLIAPYHSISEDGYGITDTLRYRMYRFEDSHVGPLLD